MDSYLDTIYFIEEYGADKYPQKLCNYITNKYFITRGKVLDIGSGKGNHLVGFARNGHEVFGIDKRRECTTSLDGFNIKECDIETDRFPFKSNTFDWIFSKSVLEHINNTDNFMKESLRVLKSGGKVVIMTPAWESQYRFFWDDYTHVRPFTRKSLQNSMRITGFRDVDVSYFLQLPFVWKYPNLKFVAKIISALPDSLKWKDREQSDARKLIRFSKEQMLFAVGVK